MHVQVCGMALFGFCSVYNLFRVTNRRSTHHSFDGGSQRQLRGARVMSANEIVSTREPYFPLHD
jgi:hypothetical protein